MSVPKPRIWQTASRYIVPASERLTAYWMPPVWRWSCGCGAGWTRMTPFREVVNAATQHSKRHAADRVVEELDRRVAAAMHDYRHRSLREQALEAWMALGNAEGIEAAAVLVRQYLGKTP